MLEERSSLEMMDKGERLTYFCEQDDFVMRGTIFTLKTVYKVALTSTDV